VEFRRASWALLRPLRSEVDSDVESGLGGRLDTRVTFGGRGKEPMLAVFRRVGSEVVSGEVMGEVGDTDGNAGTPVVPRVGNAGVERLLLLGVGSPERVTERRGVLCAGVGNPEPEDRGRSSDDMSVMSESCDLVLCIGSAGSGPNGGASDGREGRWSEVMVVVIIPCVTLLPRLYCTRPRRVVLRRRRRDAGFRLSVLPFHFHS
jgi:hypothetical protein